MSLNKIVHTILKISITEINSPNEIISRSEMTEWNWKINRNNLIQRTERLEKNEQNFGGMWILSGV